MRYFLLTLSFVTAAACSSPTAPSQPTLETAPTLFKREGTGPAEFMLPAGTTRVRITAQAKLNSCNDFLVFVGQRMVAHSIIGTCQAAGGQSYEGTADVLGLGVAIRLAVDDPMPASWVVEEIR